MSKLNLIERQSFARIPRQLNMPNMLGIQLDSFREFLQLDTPIEERKDTGLNQVFNSLFPIEDSHGNYLLEYVGYSAGRSKYSVDECIERGVSYEIPLKVQLRLHVAEEGAEKGEYSDTIEQEIFFGNIPMMTDRGTFIINGAERVIVSQLQRSPGVFFDENVHPNGTKLFNARIIPFRGSWIDFTTDIYDALYVIIDRRRKFPVTTLLRALGFPNTEDILEAHGLLHTRELNKEGIKTVAGKKLAADVVDTETGEVLADWGKACEKDEVQEWADQGITEVKYLEARDELVVELLLNTLKKDQAEDEEEALKIIYQNVRSSEPPNIDTARKFVDRMFFSPKKYDLGEVGRYRINKKFNQDVPLDQTTLTKDDFITILEHLIDMRLGLAESDDIDHLGNRRVRTVGEQLGNQFTIALTRMSRTIKERMNMRDTENLTPKDLVNSRIVSSVINSFFGTSQLSQFMDQTNPLAELTHKRRLSALGPGGLTRERAGFEVRDVHYTHYGRLCPIETPEGPNIGLISSLATYAKVNRLGFIETPYRKVFSDNGSTKITDDVEYLSADDEGRATIAQANAPVDESGKFTSESVRARIRSEFIKIAPEKVGYQDVSPNQIVSVAAALIPFLEHDDANRALMGSNMQRQAVPLLTPEAAIVGTGLERRAAIDSKSVVTSAVDGTVVKVEADHIVIKADNPEVQDEDVRFSEQDDLYHYSLHKFLRTNQDTSVNQKPLVSVGDSVKAGDVIADGSATERGDLALGRNLLVAFMPWQGYNFEDAIVISERLVKDDTLTSVHIKEVELEVRDTKRGEEELTREIPNVSEEATRNLDENGLIRVGAEVEPGDILIGKVTPKGETDPTPEEKLLRAIFGEKAGEVKDASKKADPGVRGVVVDTKLFHRRSSESRKQEDRKISAIKKTGEERKKQLEEKRIHKLTTLLEGYESIGIKDKAGKSMLRAGTSLTEDNLRGIDLDAVDVDTPWVDDDKVNEKIRKIFANYYEARNSIDEDVETEIYKLKVGDELQPGVLQLAKVYIASKRKIAVGDKMAGRHGNKGVIATIVPEEDMPFMEDGTPVDLILNPLGVPSRMNLGQLYETMLGWAGRQLGVYFSTPVFDGASLDDVHDYLEKAELPQNSKVTLFDGQTGEPFDNQITTGFIYMMKLSHMVEDKVHSRSTGPYSLITQQPLGGKAQFGGQRFGEMEVWALEAYGAGYTLQEMLTVKSDDVEGRSRAYNAIVKGENLPEFGVPESFNVLLRELQGLGIDVELK
ncbi:MAG TPA: DNA-directed RNA polymerase subunit beta [bacterium]|nr:DNA-directed RNA polymerase subunit beta [bacterium]